ncbi:MAG TPA: hypothetical protein PLD02_16885, partial [Saprospiraceae bacterium]|nr:hypothetical protein [Saprospiraceae bacterium]
QVYSFKTEHGGQSVSPAGVSYPAYPEISTGQKKFYKWSNDNRTYTELAAPGVIDHSSGNIILFAS